MNEITDSHPNESMETDDLVGGEEFNGQLLNRNNLLILNNTNLELNDQEIDNLIKQNNLELNSNNLISTILCIYNGQTSGRNKFYRLFTLRNLNNLDNLNTNKLAILKQYLEENLQFDELTNNSKLFNNLNDRLNNEQLDDEFNDDDNLNEFWSKINLDLFDEQTLDANQDRSILMCFNCKLTFTSKDQLVKHTNLKHNAQFKNAEKYLLFKQCPQSAILQLTTNQNRPILTFLSTLTSLKNSNLNKLASQQQPQLSTNSNLELDELDEDENDDDDSNIQTNLQVATNNFLNSLLGDRKESQKNLDQKDNESMSFNDELNDLANLENIAKVAAVLQQQASADQNDQLNNLNLLINNTQSTPNSSSSAQLNNNVNNSIFNNQTANSILNSLAGNNNAAVANLVNLLPQLTVQQQQQLQLLASVNNSNLLNSNLNSNNLSNNLQSTQSSNQQQNNQTTQSINSQQLNVAANFGQHNMAMQHSRNSCKTLKCPKCNWHYKYPETLEIHMKEKHSETELNCVYCLANQSHPRLQRGETYACGYKPYRCDVCNYSTTTKGNLSIHMQSDKHINNVQELSNTNLPPELLQNLVQQQQQLNQQSTTTNTTTTNTTTTDQQSTITNSTTTANLLSPNSNSTTTNVTASLLNSLTNNSTDNNFSNNSQTQLNQNINLASSLQQNSQQQSQQQQQQQSSSNSKTQPNFRCDVCKYDTNLQRNLRIHMTSEKHINNMNLLQQNVLQIQQLNALQQQQQSASNNSQNSPSPVAAAANNNLDSTTQAMLQNLNPNLLAALCSASNNKSSNANSSNSQLENQQELDLAFNQAALLMNNQLNQQRQLNNSNSNLNNSNNNNNQLSNELLMLLPSDRQAIVDLEHPDPSLRMDYKDYDEHHCSIFQCMVCAVFTCDSIDKLAAHLSQDRTKIREDEVLVQITSGNDKSVQSFCKLCQYKSNLKANFQLHCKTDKHLQHLQQVNHIKEGGLVNDWKLKYVNVSNPIQLRCNLCDYYTNSLHKLQLHLTNSKHEASIRVFTHLKNNDNLLRSTQKDVRQTVYRCEPCSLSHSTIFALLHHLNSARHIQSEYFRQLKLQMSINQGNMVRPTGEEDEINELFTVKSDDDQDGDNSTDLLNRTQQQINSSTNQLSHLLCPLCQSKFNLRANLEKHIIDTHSVSKEGVHCLMLIVDSVKENNHSSTISTPLDKSLINNQLNNSLNSNHSGNGLVDDILNENSIEFTDDLNESLRSDRHLHKFRCTQCPLSFKTAEKLAFHSQYHLIRAASQCVLCGKTTRSLIQMQKHMETFHKEMNEQELDIYRLSLINNPLLLSIKNGCQGVLDPSITELLKREQAREFNENGSLEDNDLDDDELNEQQNNGDEQMDDEQLLTKEKDDDDEMLIDEQQLNQSNNQQNDEYLNSQNVAEDNYNDPNRKYKCHRCKVAYTRQSYLSAHNKTLYHRKGEKLTYPMEKYLDPNRPFKCEMCKESFTQKNILMTHYNSVSHLHRQNQAIKELNSNNNQLNEINELSNDELFKCNICKVSFNNGLLLDNHLQSIQHQNKASKIAQLAISGQIDLKKPLVERPNSNLNNSDNTNKLDDESNNNLNLLNEQLKLFQQLQQQQQQSNSNQNNNGCLQLTCTQCSMIFNNQELFNQHQQICLLLNSLNGKTIANNQNNLENQQLNNSANKLFNASLAASCKNSNNKPPVYKHLLETWGFEIVQQFNEHHQRDKKLPTDNENNDNKMETNQQEEQNDEESSNVENNNEIKVELPDNDEQAANEINDNNTTPIEEGVENNNSEINGIENLVNGDEIKPIVEDDEQKEHQPDDEQEEKKENDPNTNNQDQNKSKCETCLKEFSSIWILKAHKEEVHNDIVKMEKVQDFAEIYKKSLEFEHKNNIVVKSVVLENDNNGHLQRTQSSTPITSTATQSTSNTSSNTSADQQSANNDSINKSNHSQSTNELNNSTNSTNINTSNNDLTNSLLSSNNSALNSSILAANPLLSQVANMMQQQNSTNSTNSNDVASQMAQQLQVNQLLMSLSLAGAMNNNPNQQQQQQQAAMMALLQQGLPPQMLPILMANAASSSPDPMMSLFASNPMLAAAAASSAAASNPLASLLGGMTPEAMLTAGFLPGMINNLQQQQSQTTPNTSKSPSLSAIPTNNPLTVSPSASLLNSSASAQSLAAQQAAAQSGKRLRTRISDDQLKILRQYFDINNSPTEEALQEMAAKSQLPLKVIKHWFRNTLFKERQRNKDSPYNFNNPPSTYLNLEEYEKTGETKVSLIEDKSGDQQNKEENSSSAITPAPTNSGKTSPALGQDISTISQNIKNENESNTMKSDSFNSQSEDDEKVSIKQENQQSQQQQNQTQQQNVVDNLQQFLAAMAAQSQHQLLQNQLNGLAGNLNQSGNDNQSQQHNESMRSFNTNGPNSDDSMDSIATNDTSSQPNMQIYSGLQFANALPGMPLPNSLQLALQNSQLGSAATLGLLSGSSNSATSTPSVTPNANSSNNPGKRANRTRFTDYQIRILQEFFESNAYPKDDDLDYLSKLLGLSPRVIVVWFQNARQKARKVYENQPSSVNDLPPGTPTGSSMTPNNLNLTPCTTPNSATSSNSATPNPLGTSVNNSSSNKQKQQQQDKDSLDYSCKKCLQKFQRYYDLVKHMKSSCYKDENPVIVNASMRNSSGRNEDSLNNNSLNSDFNATTNSNNNNSQSAVIQNGTFQCDKCTQSFNRLDQFQEHQMAHFLNPNLVMQQNNGSSNAFAGLNLSQFESLFAAQQLQQSASPSLSSNQNEQLGSQSPTPQQQASFLLQQQLLQFQQANQLNKRKFSNVNDDDDDCDADSQSNDGEGSQCSGNGGSRSAVSSRDKRLRTTILPEQLDFLYQKYQLESNPSRKMLEAISEEVGLKKRVVQVWFQNARARSRKNQMKPMTQMINKRCPFCRALYKTRSALEQHLATRHADQYVKGEIDIDNLPDTDSGDESSMPNSSNPFNLGGLDNGDNGLNALNILANNNLLANNLLNSGGADLSQFLGQNNGEDNSDVTNKLRQLLSIMNNNQQNDQDEDDEDLNDDQEQNLNNSLNNNSINNTETPKNKKKSEFALDLSKPLDLS